MSIALFSPNNKTYLLNKEQRCTCGTRMTDRKYKGYMQSAQYTQFLLESFFFFNFHFPARLSKFRVELKNAFAELKKATSVAYILAPNNFTGSEIKPVVRRAGLMMQYVAPSPLAMQARVRITWVLKALRATARTNLSCRFSIAWHFVRACCISMVISNSHVTRCERLRHVCALSNFKEHGFVEKHCTALESTMSRDEKSIKY